ncbi:hypothetical protein, partial [Sulfitobacter sp. HI0027]|uniref:hypothetical protein n=1 Tax=Sulfitobacter sp. HI0027 TaxID=1822226 RepID=UPI001F15C083
MGESIRRTKLMGNCKINGAATLKEPLSTVNLVGFMIVSGVPLMLWRTHCAIDSRYVVARRKRAT